jgi:hypothetical protein
VTTLRQKWTKDTVLKIAAAYSTRQQWRNSHTSSYNVAKYHGWYEEATKHMKRELKPRGYWTLKKCQTVSKKFKTVSEWQREHAASYLAAYRNEWIEPCSSHMSSTQNPKRYWTKGKCLAKASLYSSRSEWKRSDSRSFRAAEDNSWIDECARHMKRLHAPKGYWTLERCKAEARKYTSSSEWDENHAASYQAATSSKWLTECCAHMTSLGSSSAGEQSLIKTIQQHFPKAHKALIGKRSKGEYGKMFELDIYVPEKRKGVEFNGTYWHSENGLRRGRPKWPSKMIKNYHKLKREFFRQRKIDYIEVTDAEWNADKESVIRKILDFLNS